MNKYLVKSIDDQYVIEADTWSVGEGILKFYKWDRLLPCTGDGVEDKKEFTRWVIACFTNWDYWMLQDHVNE